MARKKTKALDQIIKPLVKHITQVTGYFAKVASWNRGKIAELRDRAKGGF